MKKYLKVLIALFVIGVLSIVGASSVMADNTAYAVYNDNTLTFYYDDNYSAGSDKWLVGTGSELFGGCKWLGRFSDITEVIFDESFASYDKLETTSYWFNDFHNLTTITNLTNLNTSNVTDMTQMFFSCKSIKELNLSNFNTSNVSSMEGMFDGCASLTTIKGLDKWITSNVTDMNKMFYYCKSIEELDLSSWVTSSVTEMRTMFKNCSSLKTIKGFDKWDTSNVTDMFGILNGCSSLQELDLSNWDTSKVSVMVEMFYNCSSLTTIYVSDSFVTNKVLSGNNMFASCTSLVGENGTSYASMSEINPSSATDLTYAKVDKEGQLGYFTFKANETETETEEINSFWNWYRKNNVSGPISVITETEDASIDKKNEVVTTEIPTLTYDVVTVTNGAATSNPVVSDNSSASSSLVKDTMPVYFLILGVAFIGLIATLVLRVSLKK